MSGDPASKRRPRLVKGWTRLPFVEPGGALRDSHLRNSLFLMASTIANLAVGYVYWVLAARSFPADQVGVASALIAAFTLASLLSNLGAHSTMVEILPRRASGAEWSLTLNAALTVGVTAGLIAASVAIVVLSGAVSALDVLASDWRFTALFTIGLVMQTASMVLDFVFVAERASGRMLLRNSIFAVAKVLLLLAAILALEGGSLEIVAAWVFGLALSFGIAAATLVPGLHRHYRLIFRGLTGEIRRITSSLVGQHLIEAGGVLPLYLLPVLVTARLSATDNAYFYVTFMVGSLFFMISAWVSVSLFAEGSHDAESLGARVRQSVRIIAALLIPAMLVMALAGQYILRLFGDEYDAGTTLLLILTVSAIPDAITNVYVGVLRVERRRWRAATLNMAMASATVVLAWFLLPPLGITGAGWAWLAAETGGSVFVAIELLRRRRDARETESARPLIPGGAGIASRKVQVASIDKQAE